MAQSKIKKWIKRIVRVVIAGAFISIGAYATSQYYTNGQPDKSNLTEVRRHIGDYTISPVSFRSINTFFDVEYIYTTPLTPLTSNIAPLDIKVELGGQTHNLQQALTYTDTNALLVVRNGEIIFEQYNNGANAASRFISWSMAKSITSILFGIALEAGDISSIDDTVGKYLPALKDGVFGEVTLKNMLMQRAGTSYTEFKLLGTADVDILADQSIFSGKKRFADIADLGLSRANEQGEVFNYSTLTSTILGRVIEAATGTSLTEYTQEKLWKPAGMQHSAQWMLDGKKGEGLAFAGGGFSASVQDYARIGQMMLQNGKINDIQVVPEAWVKASTQYAGTEPVIKGTPRGYGYQWWTFLNTEIFEAVGIYGQFISVDPKTNTVIVKMSHWPARGGGTFARDNHTLLTAIRAAVAGE